MDKMVDMNRGRMNLSVPFPYGLQLTPLRFWVFVVLFWMMSPGVQGQNGDRLLEDSLLHTIEFSGVDVSQISNLAYKGIYQMVEVKIDGTVVHQVGLTTKGEKSWLAAPNDKKPFKVKVDQFVSGQRVDGIKRFNLHNNTYDKGIMREKLTCDASRALGIPAPRVAFAEVFINGSYWGLYTLVEAQDEIYKRTFGNNNGCTMESFGGEANLLTLMYYGDRPEDYRGHYLVDHGNDSIAWSLWIDLLYKIHSFPARSHYVDSVSKYMDIQSYFRFNAMLDYNLNAESKDRNGIFYYDVKQKKWMTVCWDQNVAFADFTDAGSSVFPNTQCTAFLDKYSLYPEFRDIYDKALCELARTHFTDSVVDARVMKYRSIIDGAVERDERKGFTYKEYELSLRDLRDFIATRNAVTLQFLEGKDCGCETTGVKEGMADQEGGVYPVPARDHLYVRTAGGRAVEYSVRNLQGVVVLKGKVEDTRMDISALAPGVYLVELFGDQQRMGVRKMVVW